jgi:hypothetical protein
MGPAWNSVAFADLVSGPPRAPQRRTGSSLVYNSKENPRKVEYGEMGKWLGLCAGTGLCQSELPDWRSLGPPCLRAGFLQWVLGGPHSQVSSTNYRHSLSCPGDLLLSPSSFSLCSVRFLAEIYNWGWQEWVLSTHEPVCHSCELVKAEMWQLICKPWEWFWQHLDSLWASWPAGLPHSCCGCLCTVAGSVEMPVISLQLLVTLGDRKRHPCRSGEKQKAL